MATANFLFYNGKLTKAGTLLISPDNRSFRYGDGFFETMKLVKGKIMLVDYHMERLFSTLETLQFQKPSYFTSDYLKEQIIKLARKNQQDKLARIRVTIFRGEGALYDEVNHFPHHLIQTWELNPANNRLNENGLVLDIFKAGRKVCDHYSSLKTNNYLTYAMAALWAKQQKLNDALILNPYDRLADATIANVFIVKDGIIKTPALTEGPVSGVMRRYLLTLMRKENMPVEEGRIEADELLQASEIFLTNAIYGIRWVKQLGNNGYTNQLSALLHKKLVQDLL
jgi:branched-chain amino acid aminotransferase